MIKRIALVMAVALSFTACKKDDNKETVLLFSPEQDKQLGAQLKAEIFANPDEYPVLDEAQYPFAYEYIRGLKDSILNTGKIGYKDEFAWEVYIIQDDSVLNAFASPGGYIFFYTGLIKYLDNEDDLMGVMGHEIAHADRRHSVKQMQRQYGISLLLNIVLGKEPGQLSQILAGVAGNTAGLAFSRDAESEADAYSVEYLSQTPYRCDGAKTFFEKLSAAGGSTVPKFLSTHPPAADRVVEIENKAIELGCDTTYYSPSSYQTFKNSLP